ncbi:hypothetical protein LIER_35154 [Lithospermum erythrorhizon]|uniref:Uncharacterized protein n=1 Tax=Lithospermum erythrorhizon TaxID=34254 RepID=A0AAV3NM50_LITER
MMREERDSAFAEKEKISQKYEGLHPSREELISSHAGSEGKLKSEFETFQADFQRVSSDLERHKDDLMSVQTQLEDCTIDGDNLSSHVDVAKNSTAVAVEEFKERCHYFELLKYVTDLGENFVTKLFHDLPDDKEEGEEVEGDEDQYACGNHSDGRDD